jgi:hypothetical protein
MHSVYALKGHYLEAQGWLRCLQPTLGNCAIGVYPERVGFIKQIYATLSGWIVSIFLPRVGLQKAHPNPGL